MRYKGKGTKQLPETGAIRTKLQPSKPILETTKMGNIQNCKQP